MCKCLQIELNALSQALFEEDEGAWTSTATMISHKSMKPDSLMSVLSECKYRIERQELAQVNP